MSKGLGFVTCGLWVLAAAGWPAGWVVIPMLGAVLVGTAWVLVWGGAGRREMRDGRMQAYCAPHREAVPITARYVEREPVVDEVRREEGIAVDNWPRRVRVEGE